MPACFAPAAFAAPVVTSAASASQGLTARTISRRLLLAGAACALLPACVSTPPSPAASDGGVIASIAPTVNVVDLTPRFLAFFEAAQGLDPDARFALWQERYNFAAVPPSPEGEAMARRLLDGAFDRYPTALDRIRAGVNGMAIDPRAAAAEVAALLGADRPLTLEFIAYVGGFEENAYTFRGRYPTVAVPVEASPEFQALVGRHEFVHAIHMELAGLSGGFERSVAELILQEGLAMRATEALMPDVGESRLLSGDPDWINAVRAQEREILSGAVPLLEAADGGSIMRMIMRGPAGLRREGYYAGWVVVGRLLNEGWTFPRLARVPSGEMPELVRGVIERALA